MLLVIPFDQDQPSLGIDCDNISDREASRTARLPVDFWNHSEATGKQRDQSDESKDNEQAHNIFQVLNGFHLPAIYKAAPLLDA